MKKLFLAVLPILALGLAACGSDEAPSTSSEDSGNPSTTSTTSVSTPADGGAGGGTDGAGGGSTDGGGSSTTTTYTLELYLKDESATRLAKWFEADPSYLVYVYSATDANDKDFYDIEFKQFYDENKNAYFEASLSVSPVDKKVILLRCDPAKVTSAEVFKAALATNDNNWGEAGKWSQTKDLAADKAVVQKMEAEVAVENHFVADIYLADDFWPGA